MFETGQFVRIVTTHIVGVIGSIIPADLMPNPADGNGYEFISFSGNIYIKPAYELAKIE